MRAIYVIVALILGLLASERMALAQETGQPADHDAVYSAGWVGDWSHAERTHASGATAGMEITPIENWLSIETSVSVVRARGGTEMPVEVAVRKPWQLSPELELMAGVAPEIVHRFGGESETFGGVSFSAHIMVWPRRNIGWFAEGAYELTFPRTGTDTAIEFSVGLLIGR